MSNADPDVGPAYDGFGNVEGFWRTLIDSVGNEADTPTATDNFHPNVADLIERFRCTLDEEGQDSLDNYLASVVEFPYYNPSAPCP